MPANPTIVRTKASALQWLGVMALILLAARAQSLTPPKPGGFTWVSPERNDVVRFERRFDGIRDSLPSNGRVGYVSEVPSEKLLGDFTGSMRFYLTQYTLTPLIVMNTTDAPVVIGDFGAPAAARAAIERNRLRVVKDGGNGVFLLERVEP